MKATKKPSTRADPGFLHFYGKIWIATLFLNLGSGIKTLTIFFLYSKPIDLIFQRAILIFVLPTLGVQGTFLWFFLFLSPKKSLGTPILLSLFLIYPDSLLFNLLERDALGELLRPHCHRLRGNVWWVWVLKNFVRKSGFWKKTAGFWSGGRDVKAFLGELTTQNFWRGLRLGDYCPHVSQIRAFLEIKTVGPKSVVNRAFASKGRITQHFLPKDSGGASLNISGKAIWLGSWRLFKV